MKFGTITLGCLLFAEATITRPIIAQIIPDNSSILSSAFKQVNTNKTHVRLLAFRDIYLNNSIIKTNTNEGVAGNIHIKANTLSLDNKSGIESSFIGIPQSTAGNILVEANLINIYGDSSISATSMPSSIAAGSVTLKGRDSLLISNLNIRGSGSKISAEVKDLTTIPTPIDFQSDFIAGIATSRRDIGSSVNIYANQLSLDNKAQISANNFFDVNTWLNLCEECNLNGISGEININANYISLMGESEITARSVSGEGGNINITTQGILGLDFRLQRTPNSDITASSEFGVNGSVTINTLNVNPSQGLFDLPANLVDSSTQIAQNCSPNGRIAGQESRFSITGRGGLPESPIDLFKGNQVLVELVDLPGQGGRGVNLSSPSSSSSIVEAQGWVVESNGNIVLVAKANQVTPNQAGIGQTGCHLNSQ